MTRVVVTGLGMVTPIGHTREESWRAFLAGNDGGGMVTVFDVSKYRVQRAHEVKRFPASLGRDSFFPNSELYRWTHTAAREALSDAGLLGLPGVNPERGAIVIGTLSADIRPWEIALRKECSKKPNGLTREVAPTFAPYSISAGLAADFGFEGPLNTLLNACSSGNHAIAFAHDLFKRGLIDVALVGGCEPLSQTEFTHFHNVKSLAPEYCQPFNRTRQGLMIGEGAAILILESFDFAKGRGTQPYAELLGSGLSCDGFHMTAPDPDGDGARRSMERALRAARLAHEQIDYISAHGTGTPINDKTETIAMKNVFGDHARRLAISSIKSMIGHTMGAASAIESIVCCLALRDQVVPPTIHYSERDPECDLDYVPNQAREMKLSRVLNNSFAFGGNNVSNIFAKV